MCLLQLGLLQGLYSYLTYYTNLVQVLSSLVPEPSHASPSLITFSTTKHWMVGLNVTPCLVTDCCCSSFFQHFSFHSSDMCALAAERKTLLVPFFSLRFSSSWSGWTSSSSAVGDIKFAAMVCSLKRPVQVRLCFSVSAGSQCDGINATALFYGITCLALTP